MREPIGVWAGASPYWEEIHAAEPGEVLLTTEHAASSQGLPVVVVAGRAYGPADLGTHELYIPDLYEEANGPVVLDVFEPPPGRQRISRRDAREAAVRAGYTVRESD